MHSDARDKEDSPFIIRNNPKVVFIEFYHSAFSLVLFIIMITGVISTSEGWASRLFTVFAIVYVLRILYRPLSEWMFVQLEVSDSGVIHTSGLLFRKRKKMAWGDIAMIDRDSDPIREKIGGMKLSIVPVATKDDACKLSFVLNKDAERLFKTSDRFHDMSVRASEVKEPSDQSPENDGHAVFRSPSKKEVLMLAIGYGEGFLVVPATVGIADNLPLIGFDLTWENTSLWALVLQIGLIVAFVAAVGVLATFLVYGRWDVTSDSRALQIASGVFTQKVASFPLHKSVFTTIKEPLGLKIFKKAQIRSISPASGQATPKNVIVPILNKDQVPEVLSMLGIPTRIPQQKLQWPLLRIVLIIVGALAALALWCGLKALFPKVPSLLVAAVFLLLLPITKIATTRLTFLTSNHEKSTYAIATYGLINRTTQIAGIEDINSLSTWSLALSGSRYLAFWKFRYIANGARALRGIQIITPNDTPSRNSAEEIHSYAVTSHPLSQRKNG